eukprot:tig00000615_g2528.t1
MRTDGHAGCGGTATDLQIAEAAPPPHEEAEDGPPPHEEPDATSRASAGGEGGAGGGDEDGAPPQEKADATLRQRREPDGRPAPAPGPSSGVPRVDPVPG